MVNLRALIAWWSITAVIAVATFPIHVRAAGFELYEMGTPDLGTASAGRAAMAKDASTVFGNPAGMTKLDRSQILVGIQPVYSDVRFDHGQQYHHYGR